MARGFIAAYWLDLVAAHDPLDTVEAAGLAGFTKVAEDPRRAVDAATSQVGGADELEQPGIFLGVIAHRLVQPRVESGASHLQHAAHRGDPEFMAVLVHEAVLHSGSLAKYRAAFFRRSRSSSVAAAARGAKYLALGFEQLRRLLFGPATPP